jgi:uncharacterized membrane protein
VDAKLRILPTKVPPRRDSTDWTFTSPKVVLMRTPAQIAGHPIHPMLVTIPIGLWIFSLAADLIALRAGAPQTWHAAALYTMVGGIIGALAAALPGLVDLLSLGDAPIKKTAVTHMSLNLTIVVLYVINAWTRYHASVSPTVSLALSVIAIAMLLVSGWLGGKMVYEAGVAVHAEDALKISPDAWSASSRRNQSAAGGFGLRQGDRAMASDSSGPGRDLGASREDRATGSEGRSRDFTRGE